MINHEELFAMSLIKGIGRVAIKHLLRQYDDIESIRSMSDDELSKQIKGRYKAEAINNLKTNFEKFLLDAEHKIEAMTETGISVISIFDDNYPELYKQLTDKPLFLYVKGNTNLLNYQKNIAIVGTRNCTEFGRKIAFNTAQKFSNLGYNIVSGLATGIDTAGHKGALSSKGFTTAILVDVENIYPKENQKLSEDILDNNGMLLSENPPGTLSHRGLLVARDRLQSGLSIGVFPIETGIVGGTMHTVQFSQDQNRLLFCPDLEKIPNYPLETQACQGVLKLINDKIAVPYSKNTYDQVVKDLENKLFELSQEQNSKIYSKENKNIEIFNNQ
ncbi:MAG: DNA-protecting protein DprA [Candidatus Scalindua sp.]|nr:DNA-protecting protein DprA [Candidatus Scalindua sp.]